MGNAGGAAWAGSKAEPNVRAVLLPAIVPVVAFRRGISLAGKWDAGWRGAVDIALMSRFRIARRRVTARRDASNGSLHRVAIAALSTTILIGSLDTLQGIRQGTVVDQRMPGILPKIQSIYLVNA
jgi:hypothetical protein